MKVSNLGSTTTTYYYPHAYGNVWFHYVFWAFEPSIAGFQYCQEILNIDGTHLYEKYKDCLLIVTGVDTDGGLYPLAFAVVEGETKRSWQ